MGQSVQKAKGTKLFLALLPVGVRQKPKTQILEIKTASDGAEISKGATTIPLKVALNGLIPQGQFFLFKDTNGIE
ncbi:MAG: hypothetical protein ICV85_12785, partial [Tolypothrix sp. T3-bin4]|nr:hypothetical protein [Tolypothrix sp. Co-bin9]MBD0303008.1 hypothetical protein [Tolypothrix sp. T3-bin4]